MAVRGGPRHRLFGADMRLTKFPLLLADAETQFNGGSSHAPFPIHRNFAPVQAILLHYKFPASAVEDFHGDRGAAKPYRPVAFLQEDRREQRVRRTTDLRYAPRMAFAGSEALVARRLHAGPQAG